jgi:hypothetical protein
MHNIQGWYMQSARVSVISPVISPGNNIFPLTIEVAKIFLFKKYRFKTVGLLFKSCFVLPLMQIPIKKIMENFKSLRMNYCNKDKNNKIRGIISYSGTNYEDQLQINKHSLTKSPALF